MKVRIYEATKYELKRSQQFKTVGPVHTIEGVKSFEDALQAIGVQSPERIKNTNNFHDPKTNKYYLTVMMRGLS